MRVNPDMSNDVLAAIWQTQSQENTALQQMSTGKRVNVPVGRSARGRANGRQPGPIKSHRSVSSEY